MELLHTLASFFIIISVIVFIHEFGHFIIARWCGVKIEAFSIGFGKEVIGWNDKHGTRWKISALPLGGYVKMFGDSSEASTPDKDKMEQMTEEEKAVSFHFKPLWKKAAIVVAGPVFNFILTIAIFTGFLFSYGLETTDPIVGDVMKGSAAEEAGLVSGDRVLKIDGKKVEHFSDIPRLIATNLGTEIHIIINRSGETKDVLLTPRSTEETDALGNKISRPMIGIKSQRLMYKDVGLSRALLEAVKKTWQITATTFDYLGQMIAGDRSAKELKGPLGIAKLSGQAADQGFYTILWFIAMLSANLGMVNLFPIPPLDGGHLLYYTIEGLRGRPMAERFQEYGFRAGFAVIICLMVFTVFNDLKQMFFS
ncbi:MAG: RIP metalloprotease RseP [Rickettsiales bacterium]